MSEVELVNKISVKLINTNASDDMVAMAAWVSHDADSEARLEDRDKVGGLINFLYRNRHMSPFEHGQFIFKVDVPLFVAREFHRHRTFSYNEVSGRYTTMKPRFYVGDTARVQHGKPGDYYFEDGTKEQTALYLQSKRKAVQAAWDTYEARLESGMAKEQAREDLPLSLMTQFYATVNPRNLMHFLSLRNDSHALKEIRDVAIKMEKALAETMPLTYAAYKADQAPPKSVNGDLFIKYSVELNNLKLERDKWKIAYDELKRDYDSIINDLAKTTTNPTYNIEVMVKDALQNPETVAKHVLAALDKINRRHR